MNQLQVREGLFESLEKFWTIPALETLCWEYQLASHLENSNCRCMKWKNSPAVFAPLTAKCRSISERDS